MKRPYDLSSMTALASFEGAARKGSFKEAAKEANVTPAAISHQIKALEEDLGCALFVRRHRSITLTAKGALLFIALQRGFEAISGAIAQVREQSQAMDVTICATTAVSAMWLMPKLTAFWKVYPSVSISQIVSDADGSFPPHDIRLGYLPSAETDCKIVQLYQDRILAIGTTRFALQYSIDDMSSLREAPLIHMNDDSLWTGWREWFEALGHKPPQGKRLLVNNYSLARQAAEDDAGAMLGWESLMADPLSQGKLIQLVPETIPSSVPFSLHISPRASSRAHLFAEWLTANV